MAERRLEGRKVLITGASSGVGAAAARAFAAEGARLALLARSASALEEVARSCGGALVLPVDLTDREATVAAVERAVSELGGIDLLVSNAAAAVFGHVLEVHPDDFDRTIDVTFGGAVNVVRAALPELRRSRGTVVATGSLMARAPLPTWASYSAAKHALRGFLNAVRLEEREQGSGVRVAMVHPGPIDSPLFALSSSATGARPRVAPDAYRPEVIAAALVEVAIEPRDELVLGGETLLLDRLFAGVGRPLAELVLLGIDRWYRTGDQPAPAPGSLWETAERSAVSGGIPSRDSLLAPLQLGRRLLPSPATPLRFARHMGIAGRRAVTLWSQLTRPVPERPPPPSGLRHTGDGRSRRDRGRATV